MHAISSYRGNVTNKQTRKQTKKATNPQTGPITIHCATKLSAQCNDDDDYRNTSQLNKGRHGIITDQTHAHIYTDAHSL